MSVELQTGGLVAPKNLQCFLGDDSYFIYVLIYDQPNGKYLVHQYPFAGGYIVDKQDKWKYIVEVPTEFPVEKRHLVENIIALALTGHDFKLRMEGVVV